MFENETFENIIDRMLEKAPDDFDKRENSMMWNALAPAAAEMAQLYIWLDTALDLVFADTTSGEFLERRAAEFGIFRKMATKSIRKAEFTDSHGLPMEVPLDSRFVVNDIYYKVIELISEGIYKLECETAGNIGNHLIGEMLPIENITDLATAILSDVITPGANEELDNNLYERLKVRVQKQPTSGNIYHYEDWALSVPGVGGVKVIPTWNGPGTVKAVLIDDEKLPASQTIVDNTFEYIEQERPIGATVTVDSATGLVINVTANVTLASGTTLEEAQSQFNQALKTYLKQLAFSGELIRYSRIATLMLDVPMIIDYENLLVNGAIANIEPSNTEVGIAGSVIFT